MRLYLREAAVNERRKAAAYVVLTRAAVWNDDIKRVIDDLEQPPAI